MFCFFLFVPPPALVSPKELFKKIRVEATENQSTPEATEAGNVLQNQAPSHYHLQTKTHSQAKYLTMATFPKIPIPCFLNVLPATWSGGCDTQVSLRNIWHSGREFHRPQIYHFMLRQVLNLQQCIASVLWTSLTHKEHFTQHFASTATWALWFLRTHNSWF